MGQGIGDLDSGLTTRLALQLSHSTVRLALLGKECRVRDTQRFVHFKDGVPRMKSIYVDI